MTDPEARTHRRVAEIERRQARPVDPDRGSTALLVIDMQEFFDDIALAIVPMVNELIASARAAGVPVIFTRHGHRDLARDGGVLAGWWHDDLAMVDTPPWQLIGTLDVRAADPIVDKTRYSAFYGTWLEAYLRRTGVTDLVICGVMTNCCCETTARDAFMRDFRVFVSDDATAAESADLHVASLTGIAYACGVVASTQRITAAL